MSTKRPSPDWQTLLTAGGFLGDALAYALGYREAADVLVEQIAAGHRYATLVYPICYCYRHCLELLLKIAIKELIRADTEDHERLLKTVDTTHDLQLLCQRYREGLALWDAQIEQDEWDAINWFHRTDPHAQTFRYAVDRHGARSFPKEVTFDVTEVHQRAHTAIDLLCGTIDWIDDCKRASDYYDSRDGFP